MLLNVSASMRLLWQPIVQKRIGFKNKSEAGVEVGSRERKERGSAVERKTYVIKVVPKEKKKGGWNICWNHEQLFTGTQQFVGNSVKKFSGSAFASNCSPGLLLRITKCWRGLSLPVQIQSSSRRSCQVPAAQMCLQDWVLLPWGQTQMK